MNKKELAQEVADRMSVTVTQALNFIDTMTDVVCDSIARKESILLQDFGHFMPWEQSERIGRNPKTGVPCMIPKRLSAKFKPGKGFINKVNHQKITNK